MKKHTQIFMMVVFGLAVLSSTVYADPGKGEKIFENLLRKSGGCMLPTFRIAMTHTKKEWKEIYQSGQMEAEINKICPKMKPLPIVQNPKYRQDILDYLEYYSSDGGSLPKC